MGVSGVCRLSAATVVAGLALAGCGGTAQDAHEPSGIFQVRISNASFPASQSLAQQSQLAIAVTNAGSKDVPNVAVTIGRPDGKAELATASEQPGLASSSRPIWIIDSQPANSETAYRNTWALGTLRPNETKTFTWVVTAVKSGVHTIDYRVSAGLNGKAKAELPGGGDPTGSIKVSIRQRAPKSCVDAAGNVVREPVPQTRSNGCLGTGRQARQQPATGPPVAHNLP